MRIQIDLENMRECLKCNAVYMKAGDNTKNLYEGKETYLDDWVTICPVCKANNKEED